MIPERRVVGMLLDGHQLNAVIAQFSNPRENVVRELDVGRHLALL